jgi:general secretion pathway protein F
MRGAGHRQLEITLKQLEVAVTGGVSLQQAFSGVAAGGWLPPDVQARFVEAVQRGGSVADVVQAVGGVTRAEVALLRSAEASGTLDETLPLLQSLIATRREAISSTKTALAYPAFLLVFASVVLPLPLAVTRGVGAWLARALPLPFAVLGLVAFAIGVWPRLDPDGPVRSGVRAMGRGLPFVGASMRASALALFADVLGRCVGSGLGLWQSVDLALDASGDPALRRQGVRLRRTIERSGSIAEGLQVTGMVSASAVSRLAVGEQTGRLDTVLVGLAVELRDEATQRRRAMTTALGAVVFGIVAVAIGWSIVQGFLGYVEMIDVQLEDAVGTL